MSIEMCINGKMVTVDRRIHGCNGRAPLKSTVMVQDGWTVDGLRCMVERPDPMTKRCVYSSDNPHDKACDGCCWRHKPVRVE